MAPGVEAITLLELNRRIGQLISTPATQNVWIMAELSDVSVRSGHCYMELLQKDESGTRTLARARGAIWASVFASIRGRFYEVTGRDLGAGTGMKVMVKASASFHPVYGMSMVISDVNPEFTMGDLLRRRREILAKLDKEGILNSNRELEWPIHPWRIAVISAPNAAGYGDFINQLYTNQRRLRFRTQLFPAVMQGAQAPHSIIASLDEIAKYIDDWDCVVIIRGGGASSDLEAFDNEDLARNIANFQLPIVIGIGHERDVTVLDYVANMRVKTPTAAAEWLVGRCSEALDAVITRAAAIHRAASERIAAEKQHIAYAEGLLPVAPPAALNRARAALANSFLALSHIRLQRIAPARSRLDAVAAAMTPAVDSLLARHRERLAAAERLLAVLSPEATLRRGYSITRVGGCAVTDASAIPEGAVIETVLARGSITSTLASRNTD